MAISLGFDAFYYYKKKYKYFENCVLGVHQSVNQVFCVVTSVKGLKKKSIRLKGIVSLKQLDSCALLKYVINTSHLGTSNIHAQIPKIFSGEV